MRMFKFPSISLIEAGFLFSVFFEPWGPVLRYLGWFVSLVGGCMLLLRGGKSELKLFIEPITKKVMWAILLWSLVVTFLNSRGLYFDLKGFSTLLEPFFAVWLSSFVITRYEGALMRFIKVWTASFICASVWALWLAFAKGSFMGVECTGTMGAYPLVTMPLILYQALRRRENAYEEIFYIMLFAVNSLLLFFSFSSGAWMAWGGAVIVFFFLARPQRRQVVKIITFCLVLALFCAVFFVFTDTRALSRAKREVLQISSVGGDFSRFTTYRNVIWSAVFDLWLQKPLTGWGWSDFKHLAEEKLPRLPGGHLIFGPHNLYLELLFKGGPLLLFLGVFLFLRGILCSYKKMLLCSDEALKLFYTALFIAILAQLFYGATGSILAMRQKIGFLFWTLYGLAVAEKPKSEGA